MDLTPLDIKCLAVVQGHGVIKKSTLTQNVFRGSSYRARTTILNLAKNGLVEVNYDTVKYTGKEVLA